MEIAVIFREPMGRRGDRGRSTNNIEHQSLDYIRYTFVAVVRSGSSRRSTPSCSARRLFCRTDFDDFQRGDFVSQMTGIGNAVWFRAPSPSMTAPRVAKDTIPESGGGEGETTR